MSESLTKKVEAAIDRLKAFSPKDGDKYYIAYSGGKDSDVIRILATLADVPHELHHNLTTVDAPETVRYIKSIPNIIIDKATYADGRHKTMWNLMPRKSMPPTRIVRWCCSELKEWGGKGRMLVTGVRWAESKNRRENQGGITVIGKPKDTQRFLESQNVNFMLTKRGGVVLNFDNEILRDGADIMSHCYRTRKTMLNPIVDWSDKDVWDFLHYYGCESNPLYKCGEDRIGCVGCPLSGPKQQEKDFARYPKVRANFVRAFERMLDARREAGKENGFWKDGESVMRWWLQDDTIDGQLSFFDENEILDAMTEE